MDTLSHLFKKNKDWARDINQKDPDFFPNLSKQQKPKYLWIGCADSRVPANQIVDLPPGEVFVHRNIANVVVHTDLNCLSVIQYAVEILEVEHIIICGHYGCGGIKSAMEELKHGLIDNWLRHIRDVCRLHEKELEQVDENKRRDRLCELNILEQVQNVCNTTIVQNAWKNGSKLAVHGWVYNLENGILHDLGTCTASESNII